MREREIPRHHTKFATEGDSTERLAAITERMTELGAQTAALSVERRDLVMRLRSQGLSHAEIAVMAGLSRGRIHQILH